MSKGNSTAAARPEQLNAYPHKASRTSSPKEVEKSAPSSPTGDRKPTLQEDGVPGMRFRKLRRPSKGCLSCLSASISTRPDAVVMPRAGSKTDESSNAYARGLAAQRQRTKKARRGNACSIL